MKVLKPVTSTIVWLSRGMAVLAGAGILTIVLLVTVEVIGRKAFNFSTGISDEVSGYLLVLTTYLGLSYAFKEGAFINVDIVLNHISKRGLLWLRLGWHILGLPYLALFAFKSWQMAFESHKLNAVSLELTHIPLYLPEMLIPVGLSVLFVQLTADTIRAIRSISTSVMP